MSTHQRDLDVPIMRKGIQNSNLDVNRVLNRCNVGQRAVYTYMPIRLKIKPETGKSTSLIQQRAVDVIHRGSGFVS